MDFTIERYDVIPLGHGEYVTAAVPVQDRVLVFTNAGHIYVVRIGRT